MLPVLTGAPFDISLDSLKVFSYFFGYEKTLSNIHIVILNNDVLITFLCRNLMRSLIITIAAIIIATLVLLVIEANQVSAEIVLDKNLKKMILN